MPLDKQEIEYYESIIAFIRDNVIMLEAEQFIHRDNSKILKIIRFNKSIRKRQLRYYEELLKEYKKLP